MKNQRNRAWRRLQAYAHNGSGMGTCELWKPEKKWKHMYLRSEKLSRAKQLGFDYPIKSPSQVLASWDVDER